MQGSMKRPSIDRTTISATMSGAPSLANSLHSFSSHSSRFSLHSKFKQSQQLQHSQQLNNEDDLVTDLLEKAKFYTSLCLGNYLELIDGSMYTIHI